MQSILDQGQSPVDQIDLAALKAEAQQLFIAVTKGDIDQVRSLLPLPTSDAPASSDASPLTVNVSDSAGFTPLMIAARLGYESIVTYLLSFPGVDVNARSENGNTSLLYAAAKRHVGIVRALLEQGANFFAVNSNADTVLMCAAIGGHLDVWEFLVAAYHEIRAAKLAAASQSQQQKRKFFSLRNDEGLTVLMCAVMGGSSEIVRQVVIEVRRELGIRETTASARAQFFPSIWESALGASNWRPAKSGAASAYTDPSPPVFLMYVDAQNLMGDTALHIAAQNQNGELFMSLLDSTGADPMRVNRRGKRAFELFDTTSNTAATTSATVEEVTDDASDATTTAAATPASSEPDVASASERARLLVEEILAFQRKVRAEFRDAELLEAERRFSELMAEEETKAGKKQAANAAAGGKNKKKNNKKKPTSSAAQTTKETQADSDRESDDENETAAAAKSATPVAVPSPAAAPQPLSSAAAPFVPLAELAAIDAASGWETVSSVKPAKKKEVVVAAPSATAAATTAPTATHHAHAHHAKSKKKSDDAAKKSSKAAAVKVTKPSVPAADANKKAKETPVATVATAAPVPAVSAPSTVAVAAPPATPVVAPVDANASLFAHQLTAGGSRWRPVTPLQRRTAAAEVPSSSVTPAASAAVGAAAAPSAAAPSASSPTAADVSASATLTSLHDLFAGLHPHIDSTDLQLGHFLGSSWSTLSLSQLGCLEEVYAALGRQIREAQFHIFQQQQQEIMSELVRTKSEVHSLRKEMAVRNNAAAATRDE